MTRLPAERHRFPGDDKDISTMSAEHLAMLICRHQLERNDDARRQVQQEYDRRFGEQR